MHSPAIVKTCGWRLTLRSIPPGTAKPSDPVLVTSDILHLARDEIMKIDSEDYPSMYLPLVILYGLAATDIRSGG